MPAKKSSSYRKGSYRKAGKASTKNARKRKKTPLPLKAFKQSIGKKFQQIKEKENDHAHGTSSKSKGRREGL